MREGADEKRTSGSSMFHCKTTYHHSDESTQEESEENHVHVIDTGEGLQNVLIESALETFIEITIDNTGSNKDSSKEGELNHPCTHGQKQDNDKRDDGYSFCVGIVLAPSIGFRSIQSKHNGNGGSSPYITLDGSRKPRGWQFTAYISKRIVARGLNDSVHIRLVEEGRAVGNVLFGRPLNTLERNVDLLSDKQGGKTCI